MSFFDEIKYGTTAGRALGYSVVLMGGEAVYVEGIRRIASVSPAKMEMTAGKSLIVIEGEDMVIDELERETVIIKGRIRSVREE